MEYFLYSVKLPFSDTQIFYRDLNSKQQLVLAKSNVLFPIYGEDGAAEYAKILNTVILECVENKEDFSNLNIIEYILFITKLRIVSIGNSLELMFDHTKKHDEEKTVITLDLSTFVKLLHDSSLEAMKDAVVEYKNIRIKLDWPYIKNENIFFQNTEKLFSHILSTVPEYIKNISVGDSEISMMGYTSNQKNEIYEKLPISIKNKIQEKVLNIVKTLSESNLFGIEKMNYFNFNFYNKSYQYFIRFLFAGDLRNIYQEYYILASKNINPSYVDGLSISDRRVFYSFVEEELKAKREQNSPSGGDMTDLGRLMDEFGE